MCLVSVGSVRSHKQCLANRARRQKKKPISMLGVVCNCRQCSFLSSKFFDDE